VGRKNIQTREEGFGGLGRAKIPDREQTKDLFFGAGKKNSPGWKTRVGLQSRPFPAYDGLTEQGLKLHQVRVHVVTGRPAAGQVLDRSVPFLLYITILFDLIILWNAISEYTDALLVMLIRCTQ
jgi:hypothetical protein